MVTLRALIFTLAVLGLLSGPAVAASINAPLTLTAVVLSKNQCKFNTKNATIDFGLLDPGAAVDLSGSALFDFTCNGNAAIATYAISRDDGLHSVSPGSPRMQHATNAALYMPYSLSLTPTSGSVPKKTVETLQVDAALPAGSYASSPAGIFNDTITITLLP